MKKTALLLAILILLGVFAGCEKVEENTDESSSDISSDASDTDLDPVSQIQYSTVVSIGKSYTPSVKADDKYEDTYGTELTDGIFAEGDSVSYSDARLSGYNASFNVIIDLENDSSRLYKFEISYLSVNTAGIAPMSSCSIYVSDDGKTWVRAGITIKPSYIEGTTQQAVLELETPIDARYVRFDITKASAWVFLDEITITADVEGTSAAFEYISLLNEAYEKDNLTHSERLSALSNVLGDSIDRTKPRILLSKGRSYVTSYEADTSTHINDGKKLTDGSDIGSSYENDVWVGFKGGKKLDITVTLSEERSDLADFALSMFSRPLTGIVMPLYVDVSVSSDNQNFTLVGRVYSASNQNQSNYTYALNLPQGVKGRYVRFSLAETESQWFLIEEAAVYIYSDENIGKIVPFYPPVVFPEVGSKTYWPSSSSNYNKNINLIAGRSYQISSGMILDKSVAEQTNHPATTPLLTDGKKTTSTQYDNGIWFKTHRGASRSIYFDLQHSSTITGYKINFLKYTSAAINLPSTLNLHVSDDGINWYLASTSVVPDTTAVGISVVSGTLDRAVQARFVRFSFDVSVHVYLDEIELFGTKYVSPSTLSPNELGVRAQVRDTMLAPSEDLLGGVKDLMLAYHNSPTAKLTKDVLLSYVAYLDTDKKIKDTMFDGFLFLPSTAALPSGGKAYSGSIKSDWDHILNSAFTENINIDALNKAVAEVKTALNKPDYKVKIYYTLLHTTNTVTNFGDVDGDGISENFAKLEDRLKALEWYMDEFLKRFNQGNYTNLEFAGFYWFHETVGKDTDDKSTIQGTSKLVHDRDTQFFWIPYWNANGVFHWPAYGFDAVCLQPNYAFNENSTRQRIADAAELIKYYNMAIEIEISSSALNNNIYFERYMDYLKGGVYYGYMTESIHMYYQGIYDFYSASISTNKRTRLIYDYTYQFVKGTLNIYPDKLDDISITASKDKIYEGRLFDADELTLVKVSVSAQNGTVSVNTDGSFRYYPNKGFTGTDTFTFSISNYLDWSEDTKVTITVK
ncbi:MAG: hypothetical protein CVU97_05210 [Firmicutes bacterium HGW-Firmicutes-21]|nr:MAG: hypothetical protein CVU97_05210 [Firmicutes bacterium HGW-Firmicutes-21]